MSSSTAPLEIKIKFQSVKELEEAYQEQILKGGYFIKSDQPAPRTTPVEVAFMLPGVEESVVLKGEVAYAATTDAPMPGMGAGMAVQFQEITPQIENAFQAAITIARTEGMDAEAAPEPEAAPEAEEENGVEPDEQPSEDAGEEDDLGEEAEEDLEDSEDSEVEKQSALRAVTRLNMQSGEKIYFTIRKMSMHQKIVAAKRGNRSVRNILFQEGNKKIMGFMLQNPQMSVPEVIQMLKMTGLSMDVIKMIAKNSSFSQSEEVKYHIVIHPKTPLPMALQTLIALNQNSLAKIAKSGAVKHQIKSRSLQLLEQRRRGN
jgi:hypothetical protein